MLLGLLALGIPVIMHLMNRELPRRLVFPSIRLIRFGRLQQPGRKGIRDPWTLLARLLLLAALILLAAGPLRRLLPRENQFV